jgi:anti-sigma B factor antagonist
VDNLPVDLSAGTVALLTCASRSRLVLAGEIDVASKSELQPAVDEALALERPIDVDVRNVRFMDSFGIATLAGLARRSPYRLRIIEPPELVRFLLDVTDLASFVETLDADPGMPADGHA